MHRRSLARFDFDSVLLPYNYFFHQNERYRAGFDEVLAICRERNVAVQVIKSIARGPRATTERTHTTWYQPLEAQADLDRAMHWAMGIPRGAGDQRTMSNTTCVSPSPSNVLIEMPWMTWIS
jgi:predicted aldo/keto reductase-like oxidoreductase